MATKQPHRKKATKPATKKAAPVRKSGAPTKQRASQLEVMTQARQHFDGRVMLMGELDSTVPGYVSTQSLALDWIVGNGGLPQSRIIDVTSDEGCGKSTFGDHVLAEVQRLDGHAYLWDTENARDARYQKKIGIVRARAGQIDAHTLEDGFETLIDLVAWHNANDPNRMGVIVWDTPAGTPTRAESDAEKKDEQFGPAKLIRSNLRKLNQHLQQGKWMLFVCNQTYMGRTATGLACKVAYGGGGIPYYSSIRLALSHPSKFWRSQADKDSGLPPVGQTVWVKCIKNRVDRPWRSKQICIHFGEGISNTYEVFHALIGAGCLQTSSGWCRFDPQGWPELAAKYPVGFQASQTHGGHMVLGKIVQQTPGMWEDLIRAYLEIMLAVDNG